MDDDDGFEVRVFNREVVGLMRVFPRITIGTMDTLHIFTDQYTEIIKGDEWLRMYHVLKRSFSTEIMSLFDTVS